MQCSAGLDLDLLFAAKDAGQSVASTVGQSGHEFLSADKLVAVDCDILVPAALENMIDECNAQKREGQARPGTRQRTGHGRSRRHTCVEACRGAAGHLANAGGVTVSYFEWVQNRQGYYWTIEEIHDRLRSIMEREGRAIWEISTNNRCPSRTAAYVHALSRLAEAIEAHGTQSFFTS